MKKYYLINRAVYWLLQFSWGILQNLVGLCIFLALLAARPRAERYLFHGAIVTHWGRRGSMGCGLFIFYGHYTAPEPIASSVLVHEFGHTVQSMLLGPFFLPIIGLPSLIWATADYYEKLRRRQHRSYYDLYCEAGANRLGERVSHERAPR